MKRGRKPYLPAGHHPTEVWLEPEEQDRVRTAAQNQAQLPAAWIKAAITEKLEREDA